MKSWKRRTRALRNKAERHIHSYWFQRRYKRMCNYVRKYNSGYTHFESCNYHICKISNIKVWATYGDIDGPSLFNGIEHSCCLGNCGVILLKENEALERTEFFKKRGMLPYQMKYVYKIPETSSEEQLKQFLEGSIEMELVWEFDKKASISTVTEEGKEWILTFFKINYDEILDNILLNELEEQT